MDALATLSSALAGRYTIERELGRGGMATVYLARDLKHDRHVALKLLDPELGALLGAERFLAEIRVTASLQHPHLLPLFDSGEAAGLLFYVMPFVDGESLRARLEREKQLPVEDAVRITTAVAAALDYAHARGVIHRDLKPENILLQAGQPVVADFGIALAVSNAGGARITQTGLSLGTPQYMSPEQATGERAIDARTDVYSLGAVTYEMLAGEPPFTGPTTQAVIARLLTERTPSVRMLRDSVSASADAAIARALAKLPADRFASAGEFAAALRQEDERGTRRWGRSSEQRGGATRRSRPVVRALPWAIAAAALAFAGWTLANRRPSPTAEKLVRFTPELPPELPFGNERGALMALSPDGTMLVYTAQHDGVPVLAARPLASLEARLLPGTDGANHPTFSPNGRWLAFHDARGLRRMAIDGSTAPALIADVPWTYGLAWITDDVIVAGTQPEAGGLKRIAVSTGAVTALTHPDSAHGDYVHIWPASLGDGETLALTMRGAGRYARGVIALASLSTGTVRPLDIEGAMTLGVAGGALVYARLDGQVMAVPLDLRTKRVTGAPVPVLENLFVRPGGAARAALSREGSLVYSPAEGNLGITIVDGRGVPQRRLAALGPFSHPRLSPDGRRVAVSAGTGRARDLWVYDLASGSSTRLTTSASADGPSWTADGRWVLYSMWASDSVIERVPADGSGRAEAVVLGNDDLWEASLAPDGRHLVIVVVERDAAHSKPHNVFSVLDLAGDRRPRLLLATESDLMSPRVSPDGRWIAYAAFDMSATDVFVRPFPRPGVATQVSSAGGSEPVWSPDGRTLYYRSGGHLLAASLRETPSRDSGGARLAVAARDTLFALPHESAIEGANYDVLPDGRHFVILERRTAAPPIVVVSGWDADVRRRLAGPR